jgi:membrane protease subunit HflK
VAASAVVAIKALPDLEELWRDFNRRLSGLFGNKGGGGGEGGGDGGSRMPSISPRQFGGGIGWC